MIRPVLTRLERSGVDLARFAHDVGLAPEALVDRDVRISRELALRVWVAAGEALRDDVLGLHVAEGAPAGVFGVIEYAIRSSETVAGAMRQLARHYAIISSSSSVVVEEDASSLRVSHRARGTPPAVVDTLFAVIVRAGREITADFRVREVTLTRAPPRDPSVHERFFRAPVRFEANENVIVFDPATAALRLVTADADIHAAFAARSAEIAGEVTGERFLERVRRAAAEALGEGRALSLESLAPAGMSARTLQRRLREHGTTLSALVDDVRHELARRYLEGGASSTEIAYLLGFSHAAAFHRAFKRWTKSTVKEYRVKKL